jgi:cytochrome P450
MAVTTYDTVDISSTSFWRRPTRERDLAFEELRRRPTISFHRPVESADDGTGTGFWAAARHADIVYVSRHAELFCSGKGVGFSDIPEEYNEPFGSFLMTDGDRHNQLRRLVSRAFTPRQVAAIDEQIQNQARTLVRETLQEEVRELVATLSSRLPLWTISEMLGVPAERRDELHDAANLMVSTQDPDFVAEGEDTLGQVLMAAITLSTLGSELAAERRTDPRDDLFTALVQAEVEGEQLTDQEIGAFTVLLGVAGNDTTRNSISHGVLAFAENPDQWERLRADPEGLLPSAVEEILRWASPVQTFRRTATCDTHIGDQPIAEGDRVVMFYGSGNRDADVFDDPWTFDITRTPNDHIAFGGGGPHFCLGANLARTQLRAVFGELARSVEHFEVTDARFLAGAFVNGINRLDCRFSLVGG